MDQESLQQKPEGALLEAAQKASGLSIRLAAKRADMSDARWRQVVKGVMHVQGTPASVVAPAVTLARMAQVVGVTPAQLREVGREDAAAALERLESAPPPPAAEPRSGAKSPSINDEIEMIYESSMSAEEKLKAIGMVLRLQAEIDARTPALRAESAGEVAPAQTEDV